MKPQIRGEAMRYSLRSLSLLVTLIAVSLGIWTNRAGHQRQVAARIEALGGEVEYAPARVPLLEKWLGKDFVTSIVGVRMWRSETLDVRFDYVKSEKQFIECIRQLPSLKRIEGLEGNHGELAERIRDCFPHIEVRLYYGGVI
jgi:hypothetical protein